MAQKPVPKSELQKAVDMVAMYGTVREASKRLNIPDTTLKNRLLRAGEAGIKASEGIEDLTNPFHLRRQIARLQDEVKKAEQEKLTHTIIKSKIIGLANQVSDMEPPPWVIGPTKDTHSPGVPTVFLSDLHWEETVSPNQVNGVNKYNMDIANARLERLAERTIRLCGIISPKFDYPGIVVALGGDCINGNLVEEMTATNQCNSMPAVLDLFGALCRFIKTLLDRFGAVFVPCVSGNHSRITRKVWHADRHATSLDWLLYMFLAKHFESDKRVTFLIPESTEALYRIYTHRFLLTHGDSFKSGDSMIGPLGPVARGSLKKASRNTQIGMEFDTMIVGHFHTEHFSRRIIMNGSLVGYNAYAFNNNFLFEPPAQQLWITNERYGLTFRFPVQVDEPPPVGKSRQWVSVSR